MIKTVTLRLIIVIIVNLRCVFVNQLIVFCQGCSADPKTHLMSLLGDLRI